MADPPADPAPTDPTPQPVAYAVGEAVRVVQPLRYLKTADPMPMLRPPDLVDPGEVGTVVGLRALQQLAVRFRRGTFLINAADLEPAGAESGEG
ncbi:MAG: NAD(P)H dehydrogenase assembly family protein [Synechococcus sp.]